jgi:cold shock CspA family protein
MSFAMASGLSEKLWSMISRGRVTWFKLDKKFGFIALDDASGDAFLDVSVLKEAD